MGLLALGAVVAAGLLLRRGRGSGRSLAPRPAAAAGSATARDHVTGGAQDWALPLLELASTGTAPAGDGDADARVATERALARFASEPQRLPRRPQLLPQLLGTLNDEQASARELAALIARDPALAATLLKQANSPLYRLQQAPVESVERAVALVGTEGLRRLVAVALMQPVMRTEGGMFGRLPERIWEHTQRATVLAARHARAAGADAFAVQLLVLLHGLGAIVVVQTLRDECQRAGCRAPQAEAAADLLRHWSPRIGRLVADQWQLSPPLLQALDEVSAGEGAVMAALARALACSLADAVEPAPLATFAAQDAIAPA
jgi:HD-like signal output (HDOD) protein